MVIDTLHRFFTTGELLRTFIRQVDEPGTLARCAQVCREWHAESISVLWHGSHDQNSPWRTPDLMHLLRLSEDPDSFRYHVGFIQKLVLLRGDTWPYTGRDVAETQVFQPGLWSTFRGSMIIVDLGSSLMREEYMRELVNPSLQSLSLFGGYYSDSFLEFLKETCSLRLLLIDDRAESISSRALQSYIESAPLQYLELMQGFAQTMDDEAMRIILQKPRLQHFCTRYNAYNVAKIQWPDFTSSIRSLDLGGHEPRFRNFFNHLPQLESFGITTHGLEWDLGREILEPLSVCHQLRELFVFSDVAKMLLHTDALTHFAKNCPLVHIFDVDSDSLFDTSGIPYTLDAQMLASTLAMWPFLAQTTLRIPVTELTPPEMKKITKSCSKLMSISINGDLLASVFDDIDISIPQLLGLHVNHIIVENHTDNFLATDDWFMKYVQAQLLRCIPNLQTLDDTRFMMRNTHGEISQLDATTITQQLPSIGAAAEWPSVRRDIEAQVLNC